MLNYQRSIKDVMRMEERGYVAESVMYHKRVIVLLIGRIETCKRVKRRHFERPRRKIYLNVWI